MRLSQLFGRTLREAPTGARTIGHQLLLRAGMAWRLPTGSYSYLPLGRRVLHKIEQLVRRKMEEMGGQELLLPSAYEGVMVDLIRREVSSYRQLPLMLYRIRAEPSGGGMIAEAHSLHPDPADLEAFYQSALRTCEDILQRCGLKATHVENPNGHRLVVPLEEGRDSFIRCSECGYAASVEWARFSKGKLPEEVERPVEKVATPGCKTIRAVADYLGVPIEKTLKAIFYAMGEGGDTPAHPPSGGEQAYARRAGASEVICVVIRGDLEASEAKLREALGGVKLHPATEEELDRAGVVAGYASPVGLSGIKVVADDSVQPGCNFVAGANEEGYHLRNVNYPRDFAADILTDIALAREGYKCPYCGGGLIEVRGIEVGRLDRLGTIEATFVDGSGRAKPIVMGSYNLDLERLMLAIVERHHDGKGIVWPPPVAPYQVHLIALGKEAVGKAEELYASLRNQGFEVLFDDRDESAGVKFNDADLIGIPLRLTISRRTLEKNGVELKLRSAKDRKIVSFDGLRCELDNLFKASGTPPM